MTLTNFRRLATVVISVFHLLTMTLFSISNTAWAQDLDSEPPVIELEIVSEGVRGETQVFSATVTDNVAVTSVMLNFRYDGETNYSSASMTLIPNTSIYTASLDSAPLSTNAIEYYVEARDGGDNRTLQGFSFDPLERALVSADAVTATTSTQSAPLSTNRKIIYGVLGLLVVGALAAGSSGSSGGGNTGGEGPDVPATITVEPFQ